MWVYFCFFLFKRFLIRFSRFAENRLSAHLSCSLEEKRSLCAPNRIGCLLFFPWSLTELLNHFQLLDHLFGATVYRLLSLGDVYFEGPLFCRELPNPSHLAPLKSLCLLVEDSYPAYCPHLILDELSVCWGDVGKRFIP